MSTFSTPRELLFFLTHPALWFRGPLNENALAADPFTVFNDWYSKVNKTLGSEFPNAMCLSTLGADGYPEGRMVLLKDWSVEGFTFYTNKSSQKGKALASHPKAAVTFYWGNVQRQVRIQGDIHEVPDSEADTYFHSRPRRSQIGACASHQSSPLESRNELDEKVKKLEADYANTDQIPRPEYWGGYRLAPQVFEFWQLRLNRLHDRIEYRRDESGHWIKKRLAP